MKNERVFLLSPKKKFFLLYKNNKKYKKAQNRFKNCFFEALVETATNNDNFRMEAFK